MKNNTSIKIIVVPLVVVIVFYVGLFGFYVGWRIGPQASNPGGIDVSRVTLVPKVLLRPHLHLGTILKFHNWQSQIITGGFPNAFSRYLYTIYKDEVFGK